MSVAEYQEALRADGLFDLQSIVQAHVAGVGSFPNAFTRATYSRLLAHVFCMKRCCTSALLLEEAMDVYEQLCTRYVEFVRDTAPPANILSFMCRQWQAYCVFVDAVACIFSAIDRANILTLCSQLGLPRSPSVTVFAYREFKRIYFASHAEALLQALHGVVCAQRAGELVDASIFTDIVHLFMVMTAIGADEFDACGNRRAVEALVPLAHANNKLVRAELLTVFETPFVKMTAAHYVSTSNIWIARHRDGYACIANEALQKEEMLMSKYFPSETGAAVMQASRSTVLGRFVPEIVGNAMPDLSKAADMALTFSLFWNKGVHVVEHGIQAMADAFGSCIATLKPTVADDEAAYIQAILDLVALVRSLLKSCFDNHQIMVLESHRALERIINANEKHPAMFTAYIDSMLRGRNMESEDGIDAGCDAVLGLLQYLADKDVFHEQYTIALSKRLLGNKSFSIDTEKHAIMTMKHLCGPQYTHKLDTMLSDFFVAKDISAEYTRARPRAVTFGAMPLTSSLWVTFSKLDEVCLPPVMARLRDDFQLFWETRTNHVKMLHWVWTQGTASVNVRFSSTVQKTLNGTTLQALVLLFFARPGQSYTFVQLQDVTRITTDVLKRVLGSLSAVKGCLVLKKSPASSRIQDTDVFELNEAFAHPKLELPLPVPVFAETTTVSHVSDDRKASVDACIVRIMKARKELAHSVLMTEVTAQSKYFRPEPRLIKQRIEYLLSQEYIRRADALSPSSPYVYVPGEYG